MEYRFAGPIRRLFAYLFDVVLIIGVLRLFMPANYYPNIIDYRILAVVAALIVYESLLTHYIGATVGKIIVASRVIEHDVGSKPSLLRTIIRSWSKLAFGLPILSGTIISYLCVLYLAINVFKMVIADGHRSIHDSVASTDVIL